MPPSLATLSPDGFETRDPLPGKAKRTAGPRTRLTDVILGHLPMAVAVVDDQARLLYWNTQAAVLWDLPPFLTAERPQLVNVLARLTMLSASQQDRIIRFCNEHIEQGDHAEPKTWLRISPNRDWRLSVQVRGIGRGAWLVLLHDSRTDDMLARGAADQRPPDGAYDVLTMVRGVRHFEQLLFGLPADSDHAVLLIDVDGLDSVNATRGRNVGDSLLCLIARRLPRGMRDDDVLARWQDDSFAVLIPNSQGAQPLAQRLLKTLAQPFLINGQPLTASFGIGIATWRGSAEALMENAQAALSAAKRRGPNQSVSFHDLPAEIAVGMDHSRRNMAKDHDIFSK